MVRKQIKTRIKKVKVELTPGEKQIRKIGGALDRDYRHFCEVVETINRNYFTLFDLMGFNNPEDTDIVIDILLKESIFYWAKEAYIARETEKVENGKIKLEKLLSKRTLNKEYPTQEEKDKTFRREIHRSLAMRYNKIEEYYHKECGYPLTGFHKFALKICGKALSLTSKGFIIDENKFMEIYWDYLEANDSQTGKQHQEAADAINRFFNGQVEITDKEMERYFILEHGIVKPNPKSINRESYMRLGYRGKVKINKK